MLNQPQREIVNIIDKQLSSVQVVIVSGYSGAGKNTVMHSLEDVGYFCVNNLPSNLLQQFFESIVQGKIDAERIALGLDVRGDIVTIINKIDRLKNVWPFSLKIVFVASSAQVLLKRFQETRRRHPLITVENDLMQAIAQEQELLQPLFDMADLHLDTDQFTIHQLRQFVIKAFSVDGKQEMLVTVTAFGFKYGVPPESNLLFDVRFLPNPFFEPTLKQLRGTDKAVYDYLFDQPIVNDYWERLQSFATYVINQSVAEGRFSINIAIGCTGGRHRSVAFTQRLCQETIDKVIFLPRFRDIDRDSYE